MRNLSYREYVLSVLMIGVAMLLVQGCAASKKDFPSYYYLQRDPVRVAVMPSVNNTEHPEATIVFNKACEEALQNRGFEVVSADQVVTYASSLGATLMEVTDRKASQLGGDLKVDFILYSTINQWESKYIVLKTTTTVSGNSRLVEASTDAVVWTYNWVLQEQSGSGGNNSLLGMIVDAAVTAVVNSATDECSTLGNRAAVATVNSAPRPGFAPIAENTEK